MVLWIRDHQCIWSDFGFWWWQMMWDAGSSSSYTHNVKVDECIMSIEVLYSRHGVVGAMIGPSLMKRFHSDADGE